MLPETGEIQMQSNFKNHVVRLSKLRDMYHDQLDARTLAELNDVIHELNQVGSGMQISQSVGLGLRALQIIDTVLRLVTNLNDLMK